MPEREPTSGQAPQPEPAPIPAPPPSPTSSRKLVRSRRDRVVAGVCGGLAEYLGVDSVLVRIAAVLLVFAGGAGLVLYVIGWIAMPDAPETPTGDAEAPVTPRAEEERTRGAILLGLVFVALGIFFLLDEIWPDFLSWQYVWPIALIAIGLAVLARARR
jgi:phage shock protein PspC (stress-responsive transcriptional regulator)